MSMEPVNSWELDVAPRERRPLRRVSRPAPPASSLPANHNEPAIPEVKEPPSPPLEFFTIGRLIKEVEDAGPRKWLLREIWPSGDYGVLAGEMKTQKTWCAMDMAISVASGTPWLGEVPVDDPGPVLMFCGEGGKANIVARLRAIAEPRGLSLAKLDIVVCPRAPHLSEKNHLDQVASTLAHVQPKLVIVDPLYLAAGGAADGTNLYAMGSLLEGIQHRCQDVAAALSVIHHFNRKTTAGGAMRMAGAGPAEWGRVLISLTVKNRRTNAETGETQMRTDLDIIGGEISDHTIRLERRIWSDDRTDLNAQLHVETVVLPPDDVGSGEPTTVRKRALKDRLVAALRILGPSTVVELAAYDAAATGKGRPVRETMSRNLNTLKKEGQVLEVETPGQATVWHLADGGGSDDSSQPTKDRLENVRRHL